MLVNVVISWSKMLTFVKPAGISHVALVESVSTVGVKNPP